MDADLYTLAPKGQIWVCGACGKTSRTRSGDTMRSDGQVVPDGGKVSQGWDASCFLNAVLCQEEKDERGYWVAVNPQPNR